MGMTHCFGFTEAALLGFQIYWMWNLKHWTDFLFKLQSNLSSNWSLLWPLYPSSTTEQQMQLVIKTHKQLLSVVRLQWRNIFCIEVVTCLKNSVCSKDSCGNYSSLPGPVLLVRIEWFRILRIGVNSHISRFLAVLLEIWATVGLS